MTDFEAAYSRLSERNRVQARPIEDAIADYLRQLKLPAEANLYDALLLSLRRKDAIFTFNRTKLSVKREGGRSSVRSAPEESSSEL